MDLNDVWQENKRFIVTVGAGLIAFFIGWMVIDGMYLGDLRAVGRKSLRAIRDLNQELYSVDDRELARAENEALLASYERIAGAIEFVPRPEFQLEGADTSPQNVYSTMVETVRNRVGDLASRRRAFLPDGLGLEPRATANVDAIERDLHALDLLERALVLAVDSGVRQVRDVRILLDPAFTRRRGMGAIERTTIEVEVSAKPETVTRWLVRCETPIAGDSSMSDAALVALRSQALPILSVDMQSQRSKAGELRAKVTFLVVRIHELAAEDQDA